MLSRFGQGTFKAYEGIFISHRRYLRQAMKVPLSSSLHFYQKLLLVQSSRKASK